MGTLKRCCLLIRHDILREVPWLTQESLFTKRRTIEGSIYKLKLVKQRVSHMTPYHSYVLSENGELVKVTSEGYEYTGMFILN
jgi:hypothetical protein